MKTLIVSQLFPPAQSPRAFRWERIAAHWAEDGDQVDVVCGRVSGTERFSVCNGVRVHAVGLPVPPIGLTDGLPQAGRDSGLARHTMRTAKWIHDRTWKQFRWPDYACLWYLPAVAVTRRLLAEHSYDALISVSYPFTSHLVGLAAVKKRKLPWMVDMGDPFSPLTEAPVNNLRLYRRLNEAVERRVLRRADAITVTTTSTARLYAQAFPEVASKLRVIGPLLSMPDAVESRLASQKSDCPAPAERRRLVFAGRLYRSIRNPRPLLELFQCLLAEPSLADLELHFFGPVGDCAEEFLPFDDLLNRSVFVHGSVERERVVEELRRAHVLVNLGNATSCQLPSKLVEYISTARPVLNLTTRTDDTSSVTLSQYAAAFSARFAALAARTERYRDLVRFLACPPTADERQVTNILEPFRVDVVAGQYKEALDCGVAKAESGKRKAEPRGGDRERGRGGDFRVCPPLTLSPPLPVAFPLHSTTHNPTVSLIVPNYNGGHLFRRCMESLLGLDCPRDRLQVVVVDDCSNDGSGHWLSEGQWPEHFEIVRHRENRGVSAARNSGLARAWGEFVIFLDGDMAVRPDFVRAHCAAITRPGVVAVAGKVIAACEVRRTKIVRYLHEFSGRGARQFSETEPLPWQYLVTNNMSVRRDVLKEVGSFDESLPGYGGDDTYLAIQIGKKYPNGIRYSSGPVAVDYDQHTLDAHLRKLASYGRDNLPRLIDLYPETAPVLHADWVVGPKVKSLCGRLLFHNAGLQACRRIVPLVPYPVSNFAIRYLLGATVIRELRRSVSLRRQGSFA